MKIKQYFTNIYINCSNFSNEIIIQKIYIEEDTNTCESLKQSIQWKNIP